jgi:hypothetical protein
MTQSSASAIFAAAMALVQTAPARAETPKWNQNQVIVLAEQFVSVLDDISAASREAPDQATAMQQRTRDAAANGLRRVRDGASDYLRKLRSGQDRDLTEPRFRIVRDSFHDQVAVGRNAVPSPKVEELLNKANGILDELGRYYPDA